MNTALPLFLAVAFAVPGASLRAELAGVVVVDSGGIEVPGYVFQGSRNMRKLGSLSTASSTVVPRLLLEAELTPQPVLPALATPALRPKPRFGYGSDWEPGKTYHPGAAPVSTASPAIGPVYQFRAPYSTTEYYRRVFSPLGYGYGYHHHCSPCSPVFGSPFLQFRITRW